MVRLVLLCWPVGPFHFFVSAALGCVGLREKLEKTQTSRRIESNRSKEWNGMGTHLRIQLREEKRTEGTTGRNRSRTIPYVCMRLVRMAWLAASSSTLSRLYSILLFLLLLFTQLANRKQRKEPNQTKARGSEMKGRKGKGMEGMKRDSEGGKSMRLTVAGMEEHIHSKRNEPLEVDVD